MHVSDALGDWLADLRAARKSQGTLRVYECAVRNYIRANGDDLADITKRSVRTWLSAMADVGLQPATQQVRYTIMRLFCDFLVAEGIMPANVMHGLQRPVVRPDPVEPYSPGEIAALIGACKGWGFFETRDRAIIRVLLCTGMRRAECAGITLDRIDWDGGEHGLITILGKGTGGGKWRVVPIDAETRAALGRYLRKRNVHRLADSERLWLGEHGALGAGGIYEMLRRRAAIAGVTDVRPHRFRNTFAINWLQKGGGEMALQTIAGWSNSSMMARYARARAQQNALAEFARLQRIT